MIYPQMLLDLNHELIVDLFAGGGGASTGIEMALGRPVDIAVNHDPAALAMHRINHPQTHHDISDVFEVDPREITKGRPVGLLWASPDCTHHDSEKLSAWLRRYREEVAAGIRSPKQAPRNSRGERLCLTPGCGAVMRDRAKKCGACKRGFVPQVTREVA